MKNTFKAMLVDDQPSAREALRMLIERYCPSIYEVVEAGSIADALYVLDAEEPDLLFLDVELGDKLGFQLLERLPVRPFEVIMVTAHEKYALKAFQADALHFLLKPVHEEELVAAVIKAGKRLEQQVKKTFRSHQKLSIPTSGGIELIECDSILYAQADGSYTHVFLKNLERITASQNLSELERNLPKQQFFRVHRSYLINLTHVKRLVKAREWSVVMDADVEIDVSRKQRTALLTKLSGSSS